ncbi:MAG: AAA family ATPase [Fervidobacterium sp.]
MKDLPIGISDFRKLIEKGCIYVDKTKYIYDR